MQDLDYQSALERAQPPHVVLIGPVACRRCGAWVEWAGVDWLDRGTLERHVCEPHIAGRTQLLGQVIREQGGSVTVGPLLVAEAWAIPRPLRYLFAGIVWITVCLAIAFAYLLIAGPLPRG